MTAQLAPTPIQKFFDNNGNPLFNGKLYSYVAGTSTPQATYTDSTMGTQNTNPVILNARGEANVWLDTTLNYKLVLQESNGTQIWSVDNIPGNGVFGTVQNIAALRNVTGVGVSNYQAIIVDGYTTAGDGGGGTFWWNSTSTVADNGGTIIAPTGVSIGRWYRLYSGPINVRWFGAYGNNSNDDSTAFQNALTFAINASWNGTNTGGGLFIPAGQYLITKSLNGTSTSTGGVGHTLTIFGENTYSSVIYTTLTEAYPALDLSGNTNVHLKDFSMRQNSGCLSTAGILRAYVTGDTIGAQGVDENLYIGMFTCPGLVNETDQYRTKDCNFAGTYGGVTGSYATQRLSITSKFQTLFASADMTYQQFTNTIFTGGTPLWLCGCYDYYLDNVYLAPNFSSAAYSGGSAALVLDNSYATITTIGNVHGTIRTENQTASGTQNAISCILVASKVTSGTLTTVQKLDLIGGFENTNSSGANASSNILKTDINSNVYCIKLKGNTSYSTYPVFKLLGPCANTSYDIDIFSTTNLGTVASKTNAHVKLSQNFSFSDFATLSNNGYGELTASSNSQTRNSLSSFSFIPGAPSVDCGSAGAFFTNGFICGSYTAGSGWVTIGTIIVPAGLLTIRSGLTRTAYIKWLFTMAFSTTSLRLSVTNNSQTTTLLGTVLSSGSQILDIYLHNNSTSSGGLVVAASTGTQQGWSGLNSSCTFADDTLINIQVNDATNSNPITSYFNIITIYA